MTTGGEWWCRINLKWNGPRGKVCCNRMMPSEEEKLGDLAGARQRGEESEQGETMPGSQIVGGPLVPDRAGVETPWTLSIHLGVEVDNEDGGGKQGEVDGNLATMRHSGLPAYRHTG